MPLLNYTSQVSVDRTILQVQAALVKVGARKIMVTYDASGAPEGMAFTVETVHGARSFFLPVRAERVQAVLQRQKVERRYTTFDHAHRVAWRIVKDWLEAQLAIIQTEMVTLDQVMLPYMASPDGRTIYELYVDDQLALTAGPRATGETP
jgi:hypothetical protein